MDTQHAQKAWHLLHQRRQCRKSVNIAISCMSLFDMSAEQEVFQEDGLEAFSKVQSEKDQEASGTGTLHAFVKVLEYVNRQLLSLDETDEEVFDVLLLSPGGCAAGLRLVHSLEKHGITEIARMCLTGGTVPVSYLQAFNVQLFLSPFEDEVSAALKSGIASAVVINQDTVELEGDQLRIAFDLDSVLFGDESEMILKSKGLADYIKHEKQNARTPSEGGPIKAFALTLARMQKKFKDNKDKLPRCPIRTYVVTARGVVVAERAMRTLKSWDLDIDEAYFSALGPKCDILKAIKPHLFFDDSIKHIEDARSSGVPAAYVPKQIQI